MHSKINVVLCVFVFPVQISKHYLTLFGLSNLKRLYFWSNKLKRNRDCNRNCNTTFVNLCPLQIIQVILNSSVIKPAQSLTQSHITKSRYSKLDFSNTRSYSSYSRSYSILYTINYYTINNQSTHIYYFQSFYFSFISLYS